MRRVCKGILVRRGKGNRFRYVGEIPENPKQNEPVYLLRESDMESIMRGGETIMLQTQREMNEEFYNAGKKFLPDQIITTKPIENSNELEYSKLFLDRHFYSYDTTKHLWIRYVSVEESLNEEETTP